MVRTETSNFSASSVADTISRLSKYMVMPSRRSVFIVWLLHVDTEFFRRLNIAQLFAFVKQIPSQGKI